MTMRHGVTITKIPKIKTPETNSMVKSSHHCSKMSSDTNGCGHVDVTSKNDITLLANETRALRLCKGKSDSKLCAKTNSTLSEMNSRSPDINYRSKAIRASNLEEDEGLGIRDSNSDLNRGEYSFGDSVTNDDTDSTEHSSDTDPDSAPRFSLTGESLSCGTENNVTGNKPKTSKSDKYSKKRKFRKFLPALRRSQSVGCENELVPDNALFLETCPGAQDTNKVNKHQHHLYIEFFLTIYILFVLYLFHYH